MSIPTGRYLGQAGRRKIVRVEGKPRLSKAESRERTRAALHEAAGRLYFERGFGVTSLDDIAAAAGVTKGAVYAHFESKEDLLITLLSQADTTMADLSMFGTEGSTGDQIRAFARGVAGMIDDNRKVAVQAEFMSTAIRNERARAAYGEHIAANLRKLGEGIDAANAAAGTPPGRHSGTDVVVVIDALIQGLFLHRALNPDLVSDHLFQDALSMLVCSFITGIDDADDAIAVAAQRALHPTSEPEPR